MIYKVIKKFADLQDYQTTKSGIVYQIYQVDDIFPREGKDVSEERLIELATDSNAQGCPLIQPLDNEAKKLLDNQVHSVGNQLTKKQLIAIAGEKGIKVSTKMTKSEIIDAIYHGGDSNEI